MSSLRNALNHLSNRDYMRFIIELENMWRERRISKHKLRRLLSKFRWLRDRYESESNTLNRDRLFALLKMYIEYDFIRRGNNPERNFGRELANWLRQNYTNIDLDDLEMLLESSIVYLAKEDER